MAQQTKRATSATSPTSSAGPLGPTSPAPTTSPDVPQSNDQAREALGRANYTSAFGEKIGGLLWNQVEGRLSAEAVDGYVADGTSAAGKWLHEQIRNNASPEDLAKLQSAGLDLEAFFASRVGGALQGAGIGGAVQGWADDHPSGVAGIGALGAAGYIASNPELDGDLSRRLGDNHEVRLGGEFGNLFSPGVDAIRAGYRREDEDSALDLSGTQRFDADAWSLAGSYRQRSDFGTWSATGSHEHAGGRDVSRVGLGLTNDLANDGIRDGDGSSAPQQGPVWTAGFDADTRGAWNANVGVSEHRDQLEWFARVGAGQNEDGKTDVNAMAGLNVRF